VPPRTRTTSTAPAGRRPKVAGLRAPARPGVTGESTRPSAPRDGEDVEDIGPDPTFADTAVAEPADPPSAEPSTKPSSGDHAPADAAPADPAPADPAPADPAPAEEPPGTAAAPSRAAASTPDGRPAPSSKRRSQRDMSPAAPARTGGSRSGTALLDRPATPRRTGNAPTKQEPARRGRLAGALAGVAAPARRLGANPRALQATLGAVTVVCLVLAGLAFWQGREAWTQGPVANQAVVDVGGTAEVVGQTRQGIEQILSYDYTKLDDSVNAAKTQSTGAFTSQYLSVFEQTIRGPATQQKLRQTASVLNIGVKQLSGDHATLMALVQFTAERTTNQQTTNAPGLLNVEVVRQDGRWKISALNPM
jgi:Mce-associated membrane protein